MPFSLTKRLRRTLSNLTDRVNRSRKPKEMLLPPSKGFIWLEAHPPRRCPPRPRRERRSDSVSSAESNLRAYYLETAQWEADGKGVA